MDGVLDADDESAEHVGIDGERGGEAGAESGGRLGDDALAEAAGALQAALEARIEDGLDIPAPSARKRGERLVGTPITTALKAAVHVALRDAGVSKSELARRMQVDEKEARRMLDPRHPTKVPTLERALAVLGRRAEIEVR